MQELLGQTFSVGDGEYRVVDLRHHSGDLMVFAETVTERPAEQREPARKPKRAAFHYGDIAARFQRSDVA